MKVRIRGDEIFSAGVNVREVAAASAGDSDFLTGGFVTFEDQNRASSLSGLDGAHQTGSSCADNHNVVGHLRIIYCGW